MEAMTLKQIAYFFNQQVDIHRVISGVSVDTRTLQPGDIYFALKGERVDGHDFLAEAQSRGAVAAVVSKTFCGANFGLHLIYVEDPLEALQELARRMLALRRVRIVAVTGSVGKTTTKDFIRTLLSMKYRVMASSRNYNSQVGLPLTILNHMKGDEEIVVLEMGMTEGNQIKRLVQIAPPEVALITTVSLVHACNFDSLNHIALAKAEIFSHPHTRLGIFHSDITKYIDLSSLEGNFRKLSFSTSLPDADYYLDNQQHIIHAYLEGKTIQFGRLRIPGKHNLHNFLASVIVARYFNVSWDEILLAIPYLQLPEKRLQFIQHKDILFLNDSYNASEISVKAALETLPVPEEGGRKIAVLGGMAELGKFSEECHQRVGEWALKYVDYIYCLGRECLPIYDVWRKAGRFIELFENRLDMVEALRKFLKPKDVVLLKGSLSKEIWKVLEEF